MDRTSVGFVVLAVLLVFGMFAYANWDQTRMAAAEMEADIRLAQEPEAVQDAADLGMTLVTKVIAGTLTSLIVAAGILAYQQARIRELKDGGWERFWERRKVPKDANAKKPSVMDLMAMIWTDELMKRRKQ